MCVARPLLAIPAGMRCHQSHLCPGGLHWLDSVRGASPDALTGAGTITITIAARIAGPRTFTCHLAFTLALALALASTCLPKPCAFAKAFTVAPIGGAATTVTRRVAPSNTGAFTGAVAG